MELRNLQAFVAVARHGGFSRAARVLFSTQSTVSKAVRQLEDELGEPLLERLSTGVRLTDAGEAVYARAVTILTESEHLLAELADIKGLATGHLRLGLPIFGSARLFAPLVAVYRSRYPGVEITIMEQGSDRLEEALLAGEVELAVSLLPVGEALDCQPIREDPLVAILPQAHPLHDRTALRLAELAHDPFMLFKQGFTLNARIEAACRQRGFTPQIAARSSQVDFIIALVAAGLGVALLPRILTEGRDLSPLGAVLLDETDLRWRAALSWRKGARLSPAARAWLALAREAFPQR